MNDWFSVPAPSPDEDCRNQAAAHQNQLTKPPGSLGRLEAAAIALCAMQATATPKVDDALIVIFAGDHGIAQRGVSAFPQAVTAEMVRNFARGGAAISVLAKMQGARFEVINCGTVTAIEPLEGVRDCRVAAGTRDFSSEAAMNDVQLRAALTIGRDVIERALKAGKPDIFIAGDMGIANTSSAAALAALLLDEDAGAMTGPGTGVSGDALSAKRRIIADAVMRYRDICNNKFDMLRSVGGFEIAAMTGAYIHAAQRQIPVLVDGYIATAAALAARALNPSSAHWFIASHQSAEPAHGRMLDALGLKALLQVDMRLGEGSGAAVTLPLLKSACALHSGMATFAIAGVSGG
jgi:nicotinate-nucleotide--dimethylbenzimidazole phosphoribosyltransferase